MNDEEAQALAETFLSQQDLKGFKYEFVTVKENELQPDYFGVVFNVFSPENTIIDGPAIFLVNKETKDVSVL